MSASTAPIIAWITAAFAAMILLMSLTMGGTFMGGVHTGPGIFWIVLLVAGGVAGTLLYLQSRRQKAAP